MFSPFPTALKKPSHLQSITLTTVLSISLQLSDDISGSQLESSLPESTGTVNTAAGVPMIQRCTYRHAYCTGLRPSLLSPECKEGNSCGDYFNKIVSDHAIKFAVLLEIEDCCNSIRLGSLLMDSGFSFLTDAQEELLFCVLLCSVLFSSNCKNFAASNLLEGFFFVCNFCFTEGKKWVGQKENSFQQRESFFNKAIFTSL